MTSRAIGVALIASGLVGIRELWVAPQHRVFDASFGAPFSIAGSTLVVVGVLLLLTVALRRLTKRQLSRLLGLSGLAAIALIGILFAAEAAAPERFGLLLTWALLIFLVPGLLLTALSVIVLFRPSSR